MFPRATAKLQPNFSCKAEAKYLSCCVPACPQRLTNQQPLIPAGLCTLTDSNSSNGDTQLGPLL